jgi:uncharacterized protein (TIGR03437 family)
LPAQTFTGLASFNGANGGTPSPLVQGIDGNFYGTTEIGGVNNGGTVFKISPGGTLTTLYSFCSQANCADGSDPKGGLIQASDGNFYGTSSGGGSTDQGTVFKITPGGMLTTVCSIHGYPDGVYPYAGLIEGSDGNFYGTTHDGGGAGYGTVFKITPGGVLTTLYSFGGPDGENPGAKLVQGSDGNFYGTTAAGGTNVSGTVFKVTPGGTLTTLYSFCSHAGCSDGAEPVTSLMQASDGNFYGTTETGGTNKVGTVFKITPGGTLTTLYSFCPQTGCADGAYPLAGVIQASDGSFYGTTSSGGAHEEGTIFKVAPGGAPTTLYSFCPWAGCPDGFAPEGLVQAANGNLYGTASEGGIYSGGIVFELALASAMAAHPTISQSDGVVSGASFQAAIAPGSWITIFGTNLSSVTDTWAHAIVDGNLPTSLDGVNVSVGGEPAYIAYISPTQINALAPDVGTGTVQVAVTNSAVISAPVSAVNQTVEPAFFQWGGFAVATHLDYSPAAKNGTLSGVATVAAKPGETIILWGTGFGPTEPSVPAGVEVPFSITYYTASTVTVMVGGMAATVYGAALAPGYAGLYQVAIQIPTSLANGDYAVTAAILGAQSPSTTLITVED